MPKVSERTCCDITVVSFSALMLLDLGGSLGDKSNLLKYDSTGLQILHIQDSLGVKQQVSQGSTCSLKYLHGTLMSKEYRHVQDGNFTAISYVNTILQEIELLDVTMIQAYRRQKSCCRYQILQSKSGVAVT